MDHHYTLSHHHEETTPLIGAHFFDSSSSIDSGMCSPKSRKRRPKSLPRDTHPLPAVLQVTLGILGLWSPLQRTKSSKTFSLYSSQMEDTSITRHDREQRNGLEEKEEEEDEEVEEDSSHEYVDKNGNKCDYNYESDCDVEYGSRQPLVEDKKCSVISSNICAFLYLLLSCCLMTYDFQSYMRFYWGKKDEVLHLVSYFTYLFQIMVIPFWCFYARILYVTIGRCYRKGYPFFRSFLSTRVVVLRNSRYGAKGLSWFRLICFLVWPVTNAVLRFANDYYFTTCSTLTVYKEITHWCAFLGYVYYGCFCYLVYIERLSFECEVRQISKFASDEAPEKNIDLVRERISRFYAQYNGLRRPIRTWMAFTMVIATWGLTSHLIWNYLVFSDDTMDPQNLPVLRFLNIVIGSQKIMFFVVPCFAIGGLNLEHVWKRFRYEIARNRKYAHEAYWLAINRYLHEINVDHSGDLTPTLIFSAIGFYLGHIGIDGQEHTRWNYPRNDCNFTKYH